MRTAANGSGNARLDSTNGSSSSRWDWPGELNQHLKEVSAVSETISRKLHNARRFLRDSKVKGLSNQSKYCFFYKTIEVLAETLLNSLGYMTQCGSFQHFWQIETLRETLLLDDSTIADIHDMRKLRNKLNYLESVPIESFQLAQARKIALVIIDKAEARIRKQIDLLIAVELLNA